MSSRTAETTSLPARQSSTKRGISEGGCCKSESIITTASPAFALQEIRFSGVLHAQESELVRRSGLTLGENLFKADLVRAVKSVAEGGILCEFLGLSAKHCKPFRAAL